MTYIDDLYAKNTRIVPEFKPEAICSTIVSAVKSYVSQHFSDHKLEGYYSTEVWSDVTYTTFDPEKYDGFSQGTDQEWAWIKSNLEYRLTHEVGLKFLKVDIGKTHKRTEKKFWGGTRQVTYTNNLRSIWISGIW